MTTINFNVPLIDLKGEKAKDQTLSSVLSAYIGSRSKGQTLKLYGWHKSLQVNDPLILDDADVEELKKLITDNEDLFVFVKGQLLDVIKASK